ncbi:MAG: DUF721 domain-containing protein [Bacteroidales bacterium]|nr:DUF721 domain-containing protein [Bacteroidales bacterium]
MKNIEQTGGNLRRQEAVSMDVLIKAFIRSMKLTSGINTQRVFAAWDEVSGAGRYTVNRYFRNGILHCSMSSSVVRSHIYLQKDIILQKMNEFLIADEMFDHNGKAMPVKDIILK